MDEILKRLATGNTMHGSAAPPALYKYPIKQKYGELINESGKEAV